WCRCTHLSTAPRCRPGAAPGTRLGSGAPATRRRWSASRRWAAQCSWQPRYSAVRSSSVTKSERVSLVRHGRPGDAMVSFRPTPSQALGRGAFLGGVVGLAACAFTLVMWVLRAHVGQGWVAAALVFCGVVGGGLTALIFGRQDGAD